LALGIQPQFVYGVLKFTEPKLTHIISIIRGNIPIKMTPNRLVSGGQGNI
jgi:hypothetical protein